MKINKYHRFVFKYLLQHGKAKSFYEIAKADKNINNDNLYANALNDLNENNDIIKTKEGYMFAEKHTLFRESMWQKVFLQKDKLIDIVIGNKKMTFKEWTEQFKDLAALIMADNILQKSPYAKKIMDKIHKKL